MSSLMRSMKKTSCCIDRFALSSLRRSRIVAGRVGTSAVVVGLIWMIHSSSGPLSTSSRSGGFCEYRPSQYGSPAISTARTRLGTAADASTASSVTGRHALAELGSGPPPRNVANSPERTFTALTSSSGWAGSLTRAGSSSGSAWRATRSGSSLGSSAHGRS